MEGQIFNAIVGFFEEDDWNFNWVEGMPVLSMPFTGKNGKWMCYAQAREKQEQFVFYSVCPINVPPEKMSAAVEFITRANYGMIIGNFELDYNDGEIRYKTSIDVEGASLTHALAKQMVYANVIIMDRYLPGIMRVIYGDAKPIDEIEKIEGDQEEETKLSDSVLSDIEDILSELDNLDDLDDDDLLDDLDDDDDDDDLLIDLDDLDEI